MCIIHDHLCAPSSRWRLNQARGKRPRVGWHPAVPLRLIYDDSDRDLETMPTFHRPVFNAQLFAHIEEALEAHEGELVPGDYKLLLRRCGEAGDYVGCEKIMRRMAEKDITPDAECFFHWVNGCSENHPTKGLKIVTNLMKVPSGAANISVDLYNLTLQLLFDTDMHHDESLGILRRMQREGHHPNAMTYSLVIRSATRANELEGAWDLFLEMHRNLYLDMLTMGFGEDDDPSVAEMNHSKTENQQDVFTHLLQMLKNNKPRIPVIWKGRRRETYKGVSNVDALGLIYTAKEKDVEWEDQEMLRRRTKLAVKLFKKFEELHYDFLALGRIHFTGFVCMMQLLMKAGLHSAVVRLFLEGIGHNRKTMDFNHKNSCAVHAMDAATVRRNPGEALRIIMVLDEHTIHRNEEEKRYSIQKLTETWEEGGRGRGGSWGERDSSEEEEEGKPSEEEGEAEEWYGAADHDSSSGDYGFLADRREGSDVREIVNPRFLFNGYALAMECGDGDTAVEICDVMDRNLRLVGAEDIRRRMRRRAEELGGGKGGGEKVEGEKVGERGERGEDGEDGDDLYL
ncbi:hypothetical protein TrCOL_g13332 [Triparma columacea]|uniref:Pentatricopeptide repeat-containing protein n=1 Tax=Triparma columacea TaxID=722753 RepID=A0A9W7GJC5_9STRA|nr:hypothetical protein TrCOL_g13332 [Triparma columacea]